MAVGEAADDGRETAEGRNARIRAQREAMQKRGLFAGEIVQALMREHGLSRASVYAALLPPDQPRYVSPEIVERNERMCREHEAGKSVEVLADENVLSVVTVRSILRPRVAGRLTQTGLRARSKNGPQRVLSVRIDPFIDAALAADADAREGPRKPSRGQVAREWLAKRATRQLEQAAKQKAESGGAADR